MANVIVLGLGVLLYKQDFNSSIDALTNETGEWS